MTNRPLFSDTSVQRSALEQLLLEAQALFPGSATVWKTLNRVGADAQSVAMAAAYAEGQLDAFRWFQEQIEQKYGLQLKGLAPLEEETAPPRPSFADEEFLAMDQPHVPTEHP